MVETTRIAELADRLGRLAHSLQFKEGLNPAQWEALRFLSRANRYSSSPGALAEFLGITKGTASQTLIALESKGYIQRGRCPNDRRSVAICITDAGRELLDRDPLLCLERATRELEIGQLCALAEGMEQLLRNIQRDQGKPEFGPCANCDHLKADAECGAGENKCRCALTNDFLSLEDQSKICVGYNSVA